MRAIVLAAAGLVLSCGGKSDSGPRQVGPAKVTVTIAVSGPGTVRASGIDCGSTCQAAATVGTTLHLEAAPDMGAQFSGWSGACSGTGACDLVLSADATVGATFAAARKHTLTVAVSGDGNATSTPAGIACPGTCAATFDEGTKVELAATASAAADFSGWSGACTGATCSVTLTADLSVQASFAAKAVISVAISPAQVTLAPGATQRFTATVSGSADAAVSWSADSGFVDSTGLYTAPLAAGTYRVAAASHADPSRTGAATVTVVSSTGTTIAACGSIANSGTFSVTADLSNAAGPCLDIHDARNVTLDCGGHAVGGSPALNMSNVDGFSVTNCKFASTAQYYVAFLIQVSNGLFQHDTFGTQVVNVVEATDVRFDQNTFEGGYQQGYAVRVTLSSNSLVNTTGAPDAAMILSQFGSNNKITGNVIDGKWVGSGQGQADDGIGINDESSDTVSGNSIANVFDCGIETSGVVADTIFSDNTIRRTGFCGIGGWYWNSLRGCTISGNTIDTVPAAFEFFRIFGLRPAGFDSLHKLPADTAVYFSENVFDGNRIINPQGRSLIPVYTHMGYNGAVSDIPGERAATDSDFVLTNDTFRNDDFGHSVPAPSFGSPVVAGIIVDGGGNVCSDGGPGYPLVCH